MLSSIPQVIVADFVIVGGGTAGCVLATRLAEQGFETLLISSGANDTSNPLIKLQSELSRLQRKLFFKHYLPTDTSPNLNNRHLNATVLNTLGGSSVNSGGMERMMANDWNSFINATEDSSFSHENMSKYYKMVEKFTSADASRTSNVHGNNGPIKITQVHDAIFKEVWRNVAYELKETFSEDLAETLDYGLSFEPSSFTDGLRSWSGDAYLTPAIAKYPNLKVLTSATAIKFTLNETTKYIENVLFLSLDGFFYGVAKKEYILSAGTFYTPHILMLSGIGDPEILQKHQIPVKHELRQVGKNLMDNGAVIVQYKAENLPINESIPVGLVNTQSATTNINPDLFFILKMDKTSRNLYVVIFNASPKSTTGFISLHNSNPLSPPRIILDYLKDKRDLQTFIDSIHYVRKVMSTDALKNVGPIIEISPGMKNMDLASYIKDTLDPGYHYIGTCCMGRNAEDSVVDNHFKVHGIKNLRIVDASVFPAGFASKTGPCLTTYALTEKAADLLCKEHL
ncbi:unnamed protein product [Rotaria sp. Silwood2]|nr:unnamed protein product [Rotaria sp. Silwood2]